MFKVEEFCHNLFFKFILRANKKYAKRDQWTFLQLAIFFKHVIHTNDIGNNDCSLLQYLLSYNLTLKCQQSVFVINCYFY